jgi:integrase
MAGRRRGRDEGSIRQRVRNDKVSWEARLRLADGSRKSLYAPTRQEAARLLAAALRDRDMGLPGMRDERQTIATYLTAWLEIVRPTIRPRTWKRYEQYCQLHVVPALGRVRLTRLTPQHLQTLYAQELAAGVSPSSVNHLHTVLHSALENAYRTGQIARNVSDLVKPPRMAEHAMRVLDEAETRALLEAAAGDRFEALYVLAVSTGMRQGELLALKWRDVDLDAGALFVRATLQRTLAGFVFAEPKTARSRRQIALSQASVAALTAHRKRQLTVRLSMGEVWDGTLDLVFPNTVGRPMEGEHITQRQFYPLLRRAGLPLMRFHDLRHTAATLLLRRGINPKIVSETLGHASVAITLDIYSHVLPDMQQQAAAAMDAILGAV